MLETMVEYHTNHYVSQWVIIPESVERSPEAFVRHRFCPALLATLSIFALVFVLVSDESVSNFSTWKIKCSSAHPARKDCMERFQIC